MYTAQNVSIKIYSLLGSHTLMVFNVRQSSGGYIWVGADAVRAGADAAPAPTVPYNFKNINNVKIFTLLNFTFKTKLLPEH
jgi:hypothetical protein